MTATDKLRNLLDERGVEWTANESEYCKETCWTYMCELTAAFAEYNDGTTRFDCDTWCFTPEQAVAATLGNGTCENISDPPEGFYCSSCGWGDFAEPSHLLTTAKFTDNECGPNYCPNCGEAVKR